MVSINHRSRGSGWFIVLFALALLGAAPLSAEDRSAGLKGKLPDQSPTIDGEFVHNIGSLQMNVTNWGFFGSMPKSDFPMSEVPSAQFPSGSGVEYLYAAGIWVGARKNGIPSVTTGYPETEFRPPQGALYTIYRSFEGDLRGGHFPGLADDDQDGRYDEDWLNGLDDDGDGFIDEDFAAIGKQMFSCWYTDNQPQCSIIWPEHTPLDIMIRQESYQWGEDLFSGLVGVHYIVENIGRNYLSDVYVGIYADVDAGPRDWGSYHLDDQVALWSGVWCAPKGEAEVPVRITVCYVYDADGDEGRTPGYFGITLLGHTHFFENMHSEPNLVTFKTFRGLQPYENGGDPTNDYERYDAMSTPTIAPDTETPGDYRILITTGPFGSLPPESSVEVSLAFVCGDGLSQMLDYAAAAAVIYDGCGYDLDGDPQTGVNGRESLVEGPLRDYDPDVCDGIEEKYDLVKFQTIWSNLDCYYERWTCTNDDCYKDISKDLSYYQTGVGGKEARIHWVTGSAPTPPNIRLVPGNHCVTVLWDDLSEVTPDALTLELDFEGYQIWRADDWHRPIGTSKMNGPSADLWTLLDTKDVVNGVPPDSDYRKPFESGGWQYRPLEKLPKREEYLDQFKNTLGYMPLDTVPCPPGLTQEECDTLEALARFDMNYEGGKQYFKFVDKTAKNGMPYFYAVAPYDHKKQGGVPFSTGRYSSPAASFAYTEPISKAQEAVGFEEKEIYVVPNPATASSLSPWELGPTNDDPSGNKVEFRNLPRCECTIRIFSVSGDLVEIIKHDGRGGDGTAPWNLISRNGQDIASGVYLYSVEPSDDKFSRVVGKFVVIR